MKLWILKHGCKFEGSYKIEGIFFKKKDALIQLSYLKKELKAAHLKTYRTNHRCRNAKLTFNADKQFPNTWNIRTYHESRFKRSKKWHKYDFDHQMIIIEEIYTRPFALNLEEKFKIAKNFLKKNSTLQCAKCKSPYKVYKSYYRDDIGIRCQKCSDFLQYSLDKIYDENCRNRSQTK